MAHLLESVTGQSLSSAARIDASIEAERQTAGVPCGMMDQTVVESAHPEHALLLDCADKTVTSVPFRQAEVDATRYPLRRLSFAGAECVRPAPGRV